MNTTQPPISIYRLVDGRDAICPKDERLCDDCQTWEKLEKDCAFLGQRYNGNFFVPMRRIISKPTEPPMSNPATPLRVKTESMSETNQYLISAERARNYTEEHTQQTTQTQLTLANRLIVEAAKSGKRVAVLPERLNPDAEKLVTELGYRYEVFYDQRDDKTCIHITW